MVPTRELLNLEGRSSNGLLDNVHNAYMAKYGPDGMLYLGMGDGGGECNNNPGFEDLPQDVGSPMGKILRLDPNQPEPYAAADNPFADSGDPRVFHYGVRNAFRFNWDSQTGDFYFGDVGQDTHEEINVAPAGSAGLNFGWPAVEGDEGTCNRSLASGSQDVPPIFFSTHGGGTGLAPACSTSAFCDYSAIVGGVVYRGSTVESLRGAYLFGDWAGNNMAALYHCDGETSEVTVIDYELDLNLPNNGYLEKVGDGVPDISNITAIEEGADGEIYITANGNSLLKVVPFE
jgi:glucose/arabinose dehydrogenase